MSHGESNSDGGIPLAEIQKTSRDELVEKSIAPRKLTAPKYFHSHQFWGTLTSIEGMPTLHEVIIDSQYQPVP